jgi:hypothetical protein
MTFKQQMLSLHFMHNGPNNERQALQFGVPQCGCGRGENLLLYINKDKPPGTDNLDGKLLRLVAEYIGTPVCHIFNLSLKEVCALE